jgi:ribosomal protein L7/L12
MKQEDFEKAQFNMIVEILAQTWAIKSAVIELYAEAKGIPVSEAKDKMEKLIDYNREDIDKKMDEDYGHITPEDITK